MRRIHIGPVGSIQPGEVREVREGNLVIAVCNVDGELYAMDGICPHQGGPLAEGYLSGPYLTCPWHAWEFDVRTGELTYDPGVRQHTYRVVEENGELYVEVP